MQFVSDLLLGEFSLVLARYARTCSLHHSYGYACSREHDHHGRWKCRTCRSIYSAANNAPARRDHIANSCNMRAS